MKKVVITGATSMLGLSLIEECVINKIQVFAIIKKNSKKINLIPNNPLIKIYECNIQDISNCNMEEDNYDVMYHFAWTDTDNASRNNVDSQLLNIEYTINTIKFAKKLGCKKFIGAGSQAEYGRVCGEISENNKVSPDSAYGISKYAVGKLGNIISNEIGIEFIWTRIFSTYGINDMPSTMIIYCIDQLLNNKTPYFTKCEQIWDYLNCHDAARAFYFLGDKNCTYDLYNIGSGEAYPLSKFIIQIRDLINPNLKLGFGEKEYALNQVMYLQSDIGRLKKDFNFVPKISFQDGIKETILWRKKVLGLC